VLFAMHLQHFYTVDIISRQYRKLFW